MSSNIGTIHAIEEEKNENSSSFRSESLSDDDDDDISDRDMSDMSPSDSVESVSSTSKEAINFRNRDDEEWIEQMKKTGNYEFYKSVVNKREKDASG